MWAFEHSATKSSTSNNKWWNGNQPLTWPEKRNVILFFCQSMVNSNLYWKILFGHRYTWSPNIGRWLIRFCADLSYQLSFVSSVLMISQKKNKHMPKKLPEPTLSIISFSVLFEFHIFFCCCFESQTQVSVEILQNCSSHFCSSIYFSFTENPVLFYKR